MTTRQQNDDNVDDEKNAKQHIWQLPRNVCRIKQENFSAKVKSRSKKAFLIFLKSFKHTIMQSSVICQLLKSMCLTMRSNSWDGDFRGVFWDLGYFKINKDFRRFHAETFQELFRFRRTQNQYKFLSFIVPNSWRFPNNRSEEFKIFIAQPMIIK